jgi:hypothetical protein
LEPYSGVTPMTTMGMVKRILPLLLLCCHPGFGSASTVDRTTAPTINAPRAPVPCPRSCMEGLLDRYVTALIRHDPSGLPFSRYARFTENTREIAIGDGLWATASEAPKAFRIYGVDPATRQAGLIAAMKEQGMPVLFVLRLRVVNGWIIEAEHLIARNLAPEAMPNLLMPRAALLADVSPAEQTPREVMINAVDNYFEAIETSEGSLPPFADDCERHENGRQTTLARAPGTAAGPPASAREIFQLLNTYSCKAQFDTGVFAYIFKIWPRRIAMVDEQKGIVWAFPTFAEGGAHGTVKLNGVPGVDTVAIRPIARSVVGLEIFKIRAGRIHEIEGAGAVDLPYGSTSGWD